MKQINVWRRFMALECAMSSPVRANMVNATAEIDTLCRLADQLETIAKDCEAAGEGIYADMARLARASLADVKAGLRELLREPSGTVH